MKILGLLNVIGNLVVGGTINGKVINNIVSNTDTSTALMQFVIDEDNMISNSDTKVPTQQSVKTYVDNRVVSSVQYQGGYDATTNPALLSALKGYMYTVTVAGNFGGFWNPSLEIGDVIIAEIDAPSVLGDWTVVNKNLDAASIKAAYESNSDTNAFTNAEKTKLDGISTGADVTITALNNASLTSVTVATDDKVLIKDSSDSNNLKTVTAGSLKPELQKTLVLESPVATDDILLMELSKAITITKVTHQIFGATNVSFNVNHSGGTDLWASDKVSTTTKTSETSFTDATCTANNQVRYQASAITGTPTKIEVTVYYTED